MLQRIVFSLLFWATTLVSSNDVGFAMEFNSNDSSDFTFTPDDYMYLKPQVTLGEFRLVISPTNAPLNNTDTNELLRAIESKMSTYLNKDGVNVESVIISNLRLQKFSGTITNTKIRKAGNIRMRSLTQDTVEHSNNGRELEQTHYTTLLDMEGVTIYFGSDQGKPSKQELRHQLQAAVHANDDNARIVVGDEIIDRIILLWGIENYTLTPTEEPSSIASSIPSPIPSVIPSPVPSVILSPIPSVIPSPIPSVIPSPIPSVIPSPIPRISTSPNEAPTQVLIGVPTQRPTQGENLTTPRPRMSKQLQSQDTSISLLKILLVIFGAIGAVALFGGGFLLKGRYRCSKIEEDVGGFPSLTYERGNPNVHEMNVVNRNEVTIPAIFIRPDTPFVSPLPSVQSNGDEHEIEIEVSPLTNRIQIDPAIFTRTDDVSVSSLSVYSDEVYVLPKIEGIEEPRMINVTANNTLNILNCPNRPSNVDPRLNPHPYSSNNNTLDDLVYSTETSNSSSRSSLMQFSISTSEATQSSTGGFEPDTNWDPNDNEIDQHADDNGEEVFSPSRPSGTVLHALNKDMLDPLAGFNSPVSDDSLLNEDILDPVTCFASSVNDDSFSDHRHRQRDDASSSTDGLRSIV